MSFIVRDSGGTSLVHDKRTQNDTFKKLGGASGGFQLVDVENDVRVIFKTSQAR